MRLLIRVRYALFNGLGMVFRSLRDCLIYLTKPIFGETPLCRFLSFVWLIVGICIWAKIYQLEKGHDILFSGMFGVLFLAVCLIGVRPFFPVVDDLLVRLGFAYGLIGAATYTTIIAGDWGEADKIPFVCFGGFHAHHWMKYTIVIVYLVLAFFEKSTRQHYRAVTLGYTFAILLWCTSLFSMLDFRYFPGNRSLQIEFAILGVFFFFMAMVLSSLEASTRWGNIFMALSFGVVCGILINGYIGIARDIILHKNEIPPSLIFFNDEANCPTE